MLPISVDLDEVLRHLPAFIDEATIEGRLSTAGLARIKVDLDAALLKNLDGAETHLREELIHEAGDKEGYFHKQLTG